MQPTLNQQLAQVHQAELLAEAASNRLAAEAGRKAARSGRTAGTLRFVAAFAGLLGDKVRWPLAGRADGAVKATGAGAPAPGTVPSASVTRM